MDLTSDYPVWSILNGTPTSFPALQKDLNCEIAVIGGGITGALNAFFLADAGVDTVLIDKRDVGTGSTCGSTGLLQYEVDVPLSELISRVGRKNAVRSYLLCASAVLELGALVHKLRIDCGFKRRPSLFLARSQQDVCSLEQEFHLRREIGFEIEFWNQRKLERHFGFSRPAALFSELAGEIDPHKLTHGLLRAANSRGLQVFDRTLITKIEPTSRGITLTTNEKFTVKAKRAVIAAGFESKRYLENEAGTLKSTYAFMSEPLEGFPHWYRRSLIWEAGTPYLYLRTTADNRIIVGGEDVGVVNAEKRDALLAQKTRILRNKFRSLFPETHLQIAYAWAGTFGETKDGLAYIGRNSRLPNAYFALGYGGNGITYSLIAAKLIRDDFLGHKSPDAKIFKFGR